MKDESIRHTCDDQEYHVECWIHVQIQRFVDLESCIMVHHRHNHSTAQCAHPRDRKQPRGALFVPIQMVFDVEEDVHQFVHRQVDHCEQVDSVEAIPPHCFDVVLDCGDDLYCVCAQYVCTCVVRQ